MVFFRNYNYTEVYMNHAEKNRLLFSSGKVS